MNQELIQHGVSSGNFVSEDIPEEFLEFTSDITSQLPESQRQIAAVHITDGYRLGQAEVLGLGGIEIPDSLRIDSELGDVVEFARKVGRASVCPAEPKLIQGA